MIYSLQKDKKNYGFKKPKVNKRYLRRTTIIEINNSNSYAKFKEKVVHRRCKLCITPSVACGTGGK